MKKFKRGDKVIVSFEGTIIDSGRDDDSPANSVRISVKPYPDKYSWWAVVPAATVRLNTID